MTAQLNEYGSPTVGQCAEWAQRSLRCYMRETGLKNEEYLTAIGDLISDLGHLADWHGIDFVQVLQTAIGGWSIERRGEGHTAANDLVSIEIRPDLPPEQWGTK